MMFHHIISLPIFFIFIQTEVSAVNTSGVTLNCGFNNNFPPNVDLQTIARHCDRVYFLVVYLYADNARFEETQGGSTFSEGKNPLKNKYKNIIIHDSAKKNIGNLKAMDQDRKVLLKVGMYHRKVTHFQEFEYKANLKKLLVMARDLQYDGIYFMYLDAEIATTFLSMLEEIDYTTIWPGMELDVMVVASMNPNSIPWETYDKMITNYIFDVIYRRKGVIEPVTPFNISHPYDMTETLSQYETWNMSKAIGMIHTGMTYYFLKKSKIDDHFTWDMKTACYLLYTSKEVSWDLSRKKYTEAVSMSDKLVLFFEDLYSLKKKFDYFIEKGMKGVGVYLSLTKHAVKVPQCDDITEILLRALKYYVDGKEEMMTKLQMNMDDLLYNTGPTTSNSMAKMVFDIETKVY